MAGNGAGYEEKVKGEGGGIWKTRRRSDLIRRLRGDVKKVENLGGTYHKWGRGV